MAKNHSIAPVDRHDTLSLDERSSKLSLDSVDSPRRTNTSREKTNRGGVWFWLAVLVIFTISYALRAFNLASSWEVFVDEITYYRLSERVANYLQVSLYGNPFFLHPPAFFFLEAAYLKIVQPTGHIIQIIQSVRYLNVAAAAASAVLIFLIARTVAGWPGGLLAASIFALDPFVIRMNSRNLIEPTAMLWVLVGYALLLPAVQSPGRLRLWRQLIVGVAFGLALLSKDMMAFLSLAPLAIIFLLNWSLPRQVSLRIAAVTVLTYLPYPIIVLLSGDMGAFQDQKLRGVLRMLGFIKETGFKRPGGPSLIDSIIANLSQLSTTYALIGLGALAILVLLFYRQAMVRLVTVWALSAYGLIAYSLALGTLEEQFFYLLVVPAIVAISVSGVLLWQDQRLRGGFRQAFLLFAVSFSVIFGFWSTGVWYHTHTIADNGYERVVQYLDKNVSHLDPIAVTNDTAQFLLPGYVLGFWTSVDDFRSNKVKHVIINAKPITTGFIEVPPELIGWIMSNGKVEFAYHGRDGSEIAVYRLPDQY